MPRRQNSWRFQWSLLVIGGAFSLFAMCPFSVFAASPIPSLSPMMTVNDSTSRQFGSLTGHLQATSANSAQWTVTTSVPVPPGDVMDIEIHQQGQKIWQFYTTHGGSQWTGTATGLPAGTWHLDVGIFQPHWTSLDGWWSHVATTHSLPAPAPSWRVTGQLTALSSNSAQWHIRTPYPMPPGDVMDIEIHQQGQKIWQFYTTHGGSQWTGTATGLPAGTWHLDVGIFQPHWTSLDGWWSHVASVRAPDTPTAASSAATAAAHAYTLWQQTYVVSAGPGLLRVQRPQNHHDTVSEGIGYGMLLAVSHHNLSTFQGLWAYAQRYLDANGLMNWKIGANGHVTGTGSATDADQDMAYALILAHYQWPNHGFGSAATTLIQQILSHDVSPHNRIMPGDSWGPTSIMNPSYIALAYYPVFAQFTHNPRWEAIAQQNGQWLATHANPQTGLLPDWLNANGTTPSIPWDRYPNAWYYDAVRVPWRLWLAASSGNTVAATVLQREGQWINQIHSVALTSGYTLSGHPLNTYHSTPFISAAAFMAQDASPALCHAALQQLESWTPHSYYGASLQALTLSTLAGELNPPVLSPAREQ